MSGCRKDCEVKKENAGLRSLLDFEIQKREVQSDYSFLASNYTIQKYYTDKEYERLKEENVKQKEQIKQLEDFIKSDGEIDHINHEYTYKLKKVLQEIKAIAEYEIKELTDSAIQGGRYLEILDLITKAEEE